MNPESLTPLTFGILLLHPPLLHSDKTLKELFTKLGTVHEFTQYHQPSEGSAQFTRVWRGSNERAACTFQNQQVEIVHDFPTTDLNGFWRSASDVLTESVKLLKIPAFLVQQYLVRKTAHPLADADARAFLTQRVCKLDDRQLAPLGRPIHGVGLRLFFPATPDAPFEYDIKIESLLRDPKQLFLENTAKFLVPVQGPDLTGIQKNLESAEDFLTQTVVGFLCQFNPSHEEHK
ncbi:MAG: hypothetical protein ACRELS_07935 [Candidatus Rokuibacteriota bacterium]